MVNAVVLAGTPSKKSNLIHGRNKAFLPINHRTVIEYTLDAVCKANGVNNIAIVAPFNDGNFTTLEKILEPFRSSYQNKKITYIPESFEKSSWQSFRNNIISGYEAAKSANQNVLFVPCDIPLAEPTHIDEFIQDCVEHDSKNEDTGLYFCYIDNNLVRTKFNYHKRPGFTTLEGSFRPANLAIAKRYLIGNVDRLAKGFSHSRKLVRLKSQAMALRDIGYLNTTRMLLKYYIGKFELGRQLFDGLSLEDIEEYVGDALKTKFKLIQTKHPELEYDVDDETDYMNLSRKIQSKYYMKNVKLY